LKTSSYSISWLSTEETKPNKTTAVTKTHTKANQPEYKEYLNLNQQPTLRAVHMCVCTTVHHCRTQYSTEQFW